MKPFPSKILLFGEHIINKGAHGLAIPYHQLFCILSFKHDDKLFFKASNQILKELSHYITKHDSLAVSYNIVKLQADVENGLGFCMNIPVGYGLGSSGALVAALFDGYGNQAANSIDELRSVLAETESFFHGKSSGLDPLVSYLDSAVLVKEYVSKLKRPILWQNEFNIYLIDSKKPRKTAPLVNAFLEYYKTLEHFKNTIDTAIIPLNNTIINHFVENNFDTVLPYIKQLSQLQYEHYHMLILPEYKSLWKQGLDSDQFYLKICGAGGGGYFLAFSAKEITLDDSILL